MVTIKIENCDQCPYKEFHYNVSEYFCTKIRTKNKYLSRKTPSGMVKSQFVTYNENDDIPNECPLR